MSFSLPEAWGRLRRRRWVRVAAVALGLALVANLVFAYLTLEAGTWRNLRRVSPGWLALAVGLALVPWFTNTLRIWIWARFVGGRVRPVDAFQITLASDLGAAFTPTVAGSGAVRLAMLIGHGLSAGRASAVIVWMALEDALFFAVFLPLAWYMSADRGAPFLRAALARTGERALWVLAVALVLGLLLALLWRGSRDRGKGTEGPRPGLLGLFDRVVGWGRDARAVFAEVLRRGKLRALVALSLTAVQWVARYSVVAAVLAAFGLEVFPFTHLMLQWVVFTAGTVVPTPGGATAVEAAFAVVYQPLVPAAMLGPVTAVWRLVLFYLVLVLDALILAVFLLRARSADQRHGTAA